MVSECVLAKLEGTHPIFFKDEEGIECVTFDGPEGPTTLSIAFIERIFCADF